jgi:hypothetical protein
VEQNSSVPPKSPCKQPFAVLSPKPMPVLQGLVSPFIFVCLFIYFRLGSLWVVQAALRLLDSRDAPGLSLPNSWDGGCTSPGWVAFIYIYFFFFFIPSVLSVLAQIFEYSDSNCIYIIFLFFWLYSVLNSEPCAC